MFFSFFWFHFFLTLFFFFLPLPVLPVSTSLALAGAALQTLAAPDGASSSAALQPAALRGRATRCRSSWYTEALPLLLCFGEEETKAGNGIRVSAEHCLSQASFSFLFFFYDFILTLLYLTALSLEIRSMLFLHAVPTWCTLYVSTSAFLGVFSVVHPSLQTWALSSLLGAGARPPVLPPSFCARLCVPSGTRGRSSDRSPCSRRVPGRGRKPGICLGRGFNPI